MHIHLDPIGGWSGDMFVAAMLDALPDLWPNVRDAVAGLDLGVEGECRLVPHDDGTLTGRRFLVAGEPAPAGDTHRHPHGPHDLPGRAHASGESHGPDYDHQDQHAAAPRHGHRAWADIRRMLERSGLGEATKHHAIGIFRLLAQAEAEVHGLDEDAVTFHEVGAVDSVVDIVAAAEIVARLGAATWWSAPLPLGAGRVLTQHGLLPVPAPATALLLRGLATLDDGIAGERVTPTGAAVARYLLPAHRPAAIARRLLHTGTGFGARRMPGLSNCLRALVFAPSATAAGPDAAGFAHRRLGVVTFEVDDQSAEDLSNGLDRIRTLPGVHDVIQGVVFGKKGRVATQVQVLAAPEALENAIAACFTETTTIGLRFHTVEGAALRRSSQEVDLDGRRLRVKIVERPDGSVTAKTEASDVAGDPGHAARARLRRSAEDMARAGAQRSDTTPAGEPS